MQKSRAHVILALTLESERARIIQLTLLKSSLEKLGKGRKSKSEKFISLSFDSRSHCSEISLGITA
jgi:hypothetical protein